MVEIIIVVVIVGTAVIFAVRSFYRTLTGKNDGCGCGAKACPAARHCAERNGKGRDKEGPGE